VTLNRADAIDPGKSCSSAYVYHHPSSPPRASPPRRAIAEINGAFNTYYCGAYWRNGFHEDGVVSALAAARPLSSRT
jgi:uncharacterized protein